jgi:flagellin-like hook-associated protein FlgL
MLNDITLSAGIRANLLQLQMVTMLFERTSQRLATGKRVNGPVDDPANYFTAKNHTDRATDLSVRKDAMGESLQAVEAASNGIESIEALIAQMKGLADDARSADTASRADLATQYDELRNQIDTLADDSSYNGTNFLDSDTLTVVFNEDGTSSLDIIGFDGHVGGDLAIAAAANAWVSDTDIDTAIAEMEAALVELRSQASMLSSNMGVVTARQVYTDQMINTLLEGSDNLTLADPNEESANMLALQTRQQLGISSLSLSSQAQQAVLRLFP